MNINELLYRLRFFFSRCISNLLFCLIFAADFFKNISPNTDDFRDSFYLACKSASYFISTLNAAHLILNMLVCIEWLLMLRANLTRSCSIVSKYPKCACAIAFLLPAILNLPANFANEWNQNKQE